MSDNIDPEQIRELNANLAALNETLSKASGTAAKAPGSGVGAGVMSELFGMSKKASGTLDALGGSALGLSKALYSGQKGAAVFSDALEGLSTAILMIPGLGLVAKAATMTVLAFSKALGAVNKQGDALYKSYQDLAKSGSTASDGITGVFNNMQKFGYGIEELDKMVKLVSENSETLAAFSLTAANGASAFSGAMQGLVRDPGLKLLGKTPDDINAAGAAFIKQAVASGQTQATIGNNLSTGTREYVMQLDRLQKLTGTSADQLQKQQDEALNQDAYNQVIAELKARAAAGGPDAEIAKAQMNKILSVSATLGAEQRKQYQAGIGGDIAAMGPLFMAAPNLLKDSMDETASTTKTMNNYAQDAGNTLKALGPSAKLAAGAFRETVGSARELRESQLRASNYDERNAAVDKAQDVQDSATESLSDLELQNMNSRDALQSFVQLGVAPATKAMDAFAKGASKATSLLPGAGPAGQNSVAGKLDAMNAAGAKPMVPSGAGAAPVGEAKPVSPGPKGKEQQAYYDKMYDSLLKEAKAAGLKNAEVVAKLGAAQTSLETGYGKHMVGNNAFGIKAKQGGASVGASTQEFENGRMVTKNQNFRAYDKPEDSAKDYIKFLQENKRYKDVLGSNNLSDAIAAQGKTGYATDPNYANKLAGIAGTYGNTTGAKSNANDKIDQQLAAIDKKTAQIQAQADNNRKQPYTTPASDSHKAQLGDLDKAAQAARDKLAATTAGPLDRYQSQLGDLDKAAQAARDKLAATTTGPLNGYQSQLSGLNPSKTLPEKTDATQTAANLPVAGDDKHADLLSQILGSLDNLNHSNQQIASSTKKSVQLQS